VRPLHLTVTVCVRAKWGLHAVARHSTVIKYGVGSHFLGLTPDTEGPLACTSDAISSAAHVYPSTRALAGGHACLPQVLAPRSSPTSKPCTHNAHPNLKTLHPQCTPQPQNPAPTMHTPTSKPCTHNAHPNLEICTHNAQCTHCTLPTPKRCAYTKPHTPAQCTTAFIR
jgi:hypothetical protein